MREVKKKRDEYQFWINIERTEGPWFFYKHLPYDPLSLPEAKLCIKQFVNKVCCLIQTLHDDVKWVHLDIRLENFCFDSCMEPVFIDFDRSQSIALFGEEDVAHDSVMYNSDFTGTQNDWLQLGVMILWIFTAEVQLEQKHTYHTLDLKVDHHITRNSFFLKLLAVV